MKRAAVIAGVAAVNVALLVYIVWVASIAMDCISGVGEGVRIVLNLRVICR